MKQIGTAFSLTSSGFPELGVRADGLLFSTSSFNIFSDLVVGHDTYAPDGTLLAARVAPHGDGPALAAADVATLSGGGFAALHYLGAGSSQPFVRLYDEHGAPVTDYIDVPQVGSDTGGRSERMGAIAATADGGFVVMIGDDKSATDETFEVSPLFAGTRRRETDVRVVEYDADGEIVGGPYIAHETDEPTSWTDVNYSNGFALLPDGRYAVAYSDGFYAQLNPGVSVFDTGIGVRLSIVEDGAPVTEITVHEPSVTVNFAGRNQFAEESPAPTQPQYAPYTVALDDGGFAVLYANSELDRAAPNRWTAVFYDTDGTERSRFDLSEGGGFAEGSGNNIELATLSDGRVAVASSLNTSLTGREIFLKIIDETGTLETRSVAAFDRPQNDTGLDGLDPGADGSLHVTLSRTNEVLRFVPDADVTAAKDGASGGDDAILGRDRADDLGLGDGDDVAYGQGGADRIRGGKGDDQIEGDRGNDRLKGQAGADMLLGGDGRDNLAGGAGGDLVVGGAGNDRARGGGGDDRVYGSDGNDRLFGQKGDDWLSGGMGDDTLTGAQGADSFVFEGGADRIADFEDDVDAIVIAAALVEDGTGPRALLKAVGEKTGPGAFLLDFGDDGTLAIESDARRLGQLADDIEIA